MRTLYQFVQRELKAKGRYSGVIDGVIGRKTETALDREWILERSAWPRERKAIAFLQLVLNEKGAKPELKIDGLCGRETRNAFQQVTGRSAPKLPGCGSDSGDKFWMPEIIKDPRWNVEARPIYRPHGIVLHRTAGYFATGDYNVGKFGHADGGGRRRDALGFHFLIGKEPGEWIQFVPVNHQVAHVKYYSSYYVGIEISGDVGNWKDGYGFGEDMTPWQLDATETVVRFIREVYPDIPLQRPPHDQPMRQHGEFSGLLGHRDLDRNDHADSPNKSDWKRIMTRLGA